MSREISNSEDIIDSRDVIKRIEELESELESEHEEAVEKEETELDFEGWLKFIADGADGYDAEELISLRKLAEEGEDSPDWTYGETLIRESYFRTYAEELAEDIGAMPKDLKWPCNHIDWDAACDELKQDYMEIDFDGVTYFIRA